MRRGNVSGRSGVPRRTAGGISESIHQNPNVDRKKRRKKRECPPNGVEKRSECM